MSPSIRSAVLVLPFVAVIGGVYWFGASTEKTPGEGVEPAIASPASLSASHPVITGSQVADPAQPVAQVNAASLPEKAPLSEQERQLVLAEFFKAAEKDVKRLQADINEAKARRLARADIAVMEEKLHKMQMVMQQVQARNPGY